MTALPMKESARAVATTNITLSATQTVDGVALVAGNRCLVAGQTTASQNGVYQVNAGAWTRAYDISSSSIAFPMHLVGVSEGTINKKSIWVCTTNAAIVLGTTALTYTRIYPSYADLASNPWDPSNLGDNIERETATSTLTQTSGTLTCHGGMVLRAGITYSALNVFFTSAGATVTHTWAGLVTLAANAQWTSARQLIAVSPDNTAAPTAGAFRVFTFGTPVTPNIDTPVYFALLLAATTVPAISAAPAVASSALFNQAPILAGTSNTALTTPQAVNTAENALTAITQVAYAYLT